jgi:hypothetical protein
MSQREETEIEIEGKRQRRRDKGEIYRRRYITEKDG